MRALIAKETVVVQTDLVAARILKLDPVVVLHVSEAMNVRWQVGSYLHGLNVTARHRS
jgi:hypothetical protein